MLSDGTSRKRNQETYEVKSLLRGIIRCGHCNKSMICSYTRSKKGGRVYRYYTCGGAVKNGYDTCPVRSVPAGELEKSVIDQLRSILRSPEVIAQTFRTAVDLKSREMESFQEEKSALEIRMVELKALAGDMVASDASKQMPSERFIELNDDISQARNKLSEIETQISVFKNDLLSEQDVSDALRKLDPIWNELFPYEQHRIFRLLVESVVVTQNCIDIHLRASGIHTVVAEIEGSKEKSIAK